MTMVVLALSRRHVEALTVTVGSYIIDSNHSPFSRARLAAEPRTGTVRT